MQEESAQQNGVTEDDQNQEKYFLEHKWVLWYDNKEDKNQQSFGGSLREIYTVDTVEKFWALMESIQLPVGIKDHLVDLLLFKEGIQPTWEDERNVNGGGWTFVINLPDKHLTEECWKHLAMGMVGEQFEDMNDINGLVVNIRPKKSRILIWTNSANNLDAQTRIGQHMYKILSRLEAYENSQPENRQGVQFSDWESKKSNNTSKPLSISIPPKF